MCAGNCSWRCGSPFHFCGCHGSSPGQAGPAGRATDCPPRRSPQGPCRLCAGGSEKLRLDFHAGESRELDGRHLSGAVWMCVVQVTGTRRVCECPCLRVCIVVRVVVAALACDARACSVSCFDAANETALVYLSIDKGAQLHCGVASHTLVVCAVAASSAPPFQCWDTQRPTSHPSDVVRRS